ncbi:hypothetical protein SteCoe_10752 [Stentor coeruleus]|uniref:Arrestin-like N-terminal domain-containing protein n=1 Tax=Stentor coeruleus TaxID=5963 RepID=A0A1R2CEX8_9CILI|nr:hypothetical protein SteCoe_10752 [Stentor coeruleus]
MQNPNFIYLNLQTLTYSSGDYLKGEVYLKLVSETKSNTLILKFTGFEIININSSSDQTSKTELVTNELTLHKWDTQAPSGDFIFPFEIYLSPNLPSSTLIKLNDLTAKIEYKLEVTMTEQLTSSVIIYLKSYQESQSDINASNMQVKVKSCLCIRKLTIDLKASVNKFSYICNEVIKTSVEGFCSIMTRMHLAFCRYTLITLPDGKTHMNKLILYEKDIDESFFDIELMNLKDILDEQYSSKGNNISCSYCISIKGLLNTICHSKEPEVVIWVIINPMLKEHSMEQLYIQWNPIYMKSSYYIDSGNPSELSW